MSHADVMKRPGDEVVLSGSYRSAARPQHGAQPSGKFGGNKPPLNGGNATAASGDSWPRRGIA